MIWIVEVEWMDGTTRRYEVGGALTPNESMAETSQGLLIMWRQDGVAVPKKHVTTIPLCNIREYRLDR